MLDREASVAALSRRQFGLATLEQLAEQGIDRGAVLRRTRVGTLVRIQPCVYRLASVPTSWQQEVLAAQLAAGPDGVISHRTATRLHGFGSAQGSIVDLSVPRDARPALRGPRAHRPRTLEPSDITVLGAFRVTTVNRTLVDVAGVVPFGRLVTLLDAAVRNRLTTYSAVRVRLEDLAERGRTGVTALRAALDDRGDDLDAEMFERLMERLLVAHSLPEPVRQFRVEFPATEHRSSRPAFLDFAWPDVRVWLECDGWATHGTPAALDADLDRQNELVLLGWSPVRFAWARLRDEPDRVARQIRAALDRAQAQAAAR